MIETLIQEKEQDGGEPFLPKHNQDQHILKSNTQNPSKPVPCLGNEFAEVEEYNMLIRKMLCAIDSCKSKLENSRHSRIRKGVLSIHDSELIRFQLTHGHSVLHHVDKSLLVCVQYCFLIYTALNASVVGNNFLTFWLATRITSRNLQRYMAIDLALSPRRCEENR